MRFVNEQYPKTATGFEPAHRLSPMLCRQSAICFMLPTRPPPTKQIDHYLTRCGRFPDTASSKNDRCYGPVRVEVFFDLRGKRPLKGYPSCHVGVLGGPTIEHRRRITAL